MNVMRRVWKNVRRLIDDHVRFIETVKERARDPLEDKVIELVWDRVCKNIEAQIRSSVGQHVWIHVYSAIPIDRLREAVGIKCS